MSNEWGNSAARGTADRVGETSYSASSHEPAASEASAHAPSRSVSSHVAKRASVGVVAAALLKSVLEACDVAEADAAVVVDTVVREPAAFQSAFAQGILDGITQSVVETIDGYRSLIDYIVAFATREEVRDKAALELTKAAATFSAESPKRLRQLSDGFLSASADGAVAPSAAAQYVEIALALLAAAELREKFDALMEAGIDELLKLTGEAVKLVSKGLIQQLWSDLLPQRMSAAAIGDQLGTLLGILAGTMLLSYVGAA